ncbi:MAG: glycosyltransferase family 2 protein [Kiritimatiellia bacterium]
MRISIITACFNSHEVLSTALASVRAQTHPDVEHIVVDGASTDGTVEQLRNWESKAGGRGKWISEPDSGLYDALNKGIRKATGDVVGLLHADDFFAADDVLAQVAAAFEDPTVECVFGDVRFVRPTNLLKTVRYYRAKHFRPWMLRFGFMPPHPTFFARRELFERLGNYKTDYQIAADYELLVRFLWLHRIRYRYLDLAMTRMRLGGKSTRSLRSNLILNQEIVRGCRENGMWTALPLLGFKYLFKVFELVNTREHSDGARNCVS